MKLKVTDHADPCCGSLLIPVLCWCSYLPFKVDQFRCRADLPRSPPSPTGWTGWIARRYNMFSAFGAIPGPRWRTSLMVRPSRCC